MKDVSPLDTVESLDSVNSCAIDWMHCVLLVVIRNLFDLYLLKDTRLLLAKATLNLSILHKQSYESQFVQLRQSVPCAVFDYVERNWHPIRSQWVEGLKNAHCHYMNTTNNRLESINQKLKAVVSRYSPMTTFFSDLMKCVWSLKIEREHRALDVTVKRSIMNFEDQGLRSYQASLTPFAFQYVEQQFGLSDKVKLTDNKDGATAIVSSKGGEFATGIDDCPCGSFRAMELPCRHILAVRNLLGINTFSLQLPGMLQALAFGEFYIPSPCLQAFHSV